MKKQINQNALILFYMYLEKLEKESSNKNNATKTGKPSWYFRKT